MKLGIDKRRILVEYHTRILAMRRRKILIESSTDVQNLSLAIPGPLEITDLDPLHHLIGPDLPREGFTTLLLSILSELVSL